MDMEGSIKRGLATVVCAAGVVGFGAEAWHSLKPENTDGVRAAVGSFITSEAGVLSDIIADPAQLDPAKNRTAEGDLAVLGILTSAGYLKHHGKRMPGELKTSSNKVFQKKRNNSLS